MSNPDDQFQFQGRMHQSKIRFDFTLQKYDAMVYESFMELFDMLPICAIIDRMYFAVHAGISPETSQVRIFSILNILGDLQKVNRFTEIP